MQTMSPSRKARLRSNKGFTLLEMLIVFGLIALIGSLAIGALSGIFGGSQEAAARQFVTSSLNAPLEQFRIHMGDYPSTEEGIEALLRAPPGREARWRGPYIREIPLDPWGRPYQYRFPGTRNPLGARGFDLWSKGPNPNDESGIIGNW